MALTACGSGSATGVGTLDPASAYILQVGGQDTAQQPDASPAGTAPSGEGVIPGDGSNGPGAMPTTKVGYGYVLKDSDGGKQKITVKSMTCGKTSIPGGMDEQGNDVPYTPRSGKQFCTVRGTVENVGNGPLGSMTFLKNVMVGQSRYVQNHIDLSASDDLASSRQTAPGYMVDINPGDVVEWVSVYEVPKGKTPDAIVVQDDMDFPLMLLALPDPS